jgi:hypothetical protein
MNETYSYTAQDLIVTELLNKKQNGVYVELGSHLPITGSNTYLLEKNYNWTGLSIDISSEFVDKFNEVRVNKAIVANAVTFDYLQYFRENDFPNQIDYLSLDVDGNHKFDGTRELNNGLLSLITLPLTKYRFTVIHFEHESFFPKNIATRDAQREILSSLGYGLLFTDDTDDCWVDTSVIPWEKARLFLHLSNIKNSR